ncbi:MAG TPA: Rrf2 family transcriptional regulator [Syntrophomonadaceae bacterium]|jgi:Rrf2 family protein|nr:Rrf2 family transcriptional regulator [Syntrophomonadaceae bacterium]
MNINQATDYGFRAVLYLAHKDSQEWVDAQTISEHEAIPIRFLLKIMPCLTKAGIVKSHRGVRGGYALARQPQDISLLDVIEAIEGPIYLNRCLEDEAHCSKQSAPACPIHRTLSDIQDQLVLELSRRTFAQMMQ